MLKPRDPKEPGNLKVLVLFKIIHEGLPTDVVSADMSLSVIIVDSVLGPRPAFKRFHTPKKRHHQLD